MHDTRLYATEILLAITSSNLPWTGTASEGFSIIGYSLGGGIAASFTSYFPRLINSLVLLAPCGLLKSEKVTYFTRFFPESVLQYFAGRQLQNYEVSAAVPEDLDGKGNGTGDESVVVLDLPRASTFTQNVSIPAVVAWQLEHHRGFLHSFMSCVRYAPATNQHAHWRRIGSRLTAQNTASAAADPEIQKDGLEGGKVLVIVGQTDPIITEEDLRPDAIEALGGPQNVDFRIAIGGHEFPISNPISTVSSIAEFWGLNS
jgi:pimeloyl-ACP methyl ester carboxylesterase